MTMSIPQLEIHPSVPFLAVPGVSSMVVSMQKSSLRLYQYRQVVSLWNFNRSCDGKHKYIPALAPDVAADIERARIEIGKLSTVCWFLSACKNRHVQYHVGAGLRPGDDLPGTWGPQIALSMGTGMGAVPLLRQMYWSRRSFSQPAQPHVLPLLKPLMMSVALPPSSVR